MSKTTVLDTPSVASAAGTPNLQVDPSARFPRRQRRGGRKKGTPNKRTQERRAIIAAIQACGKDPLTFFADLLKNEKAPLDLRFAAAKELLPFMHPKLASIEARTGGLTHEDRLEEYRRMLEDEQPAPKIIKGGMVGKKSRWGVGKGPPLQKY
jgi:hypothetical protein